MQNRKYRASLETKACSRLDIFTLGSNAFITEAGQPETSLQGAFDGLEIVFGACVDEPQERFYNRSSGSVTFKVDQGLCMARTSDH